jgi:hypothetical protein
MEVAMHQQIRLVVPKKSPPDLASVLEVLAPFNILAAGGSNIEHGGEFAFAVDHGEQVAALTALQAAGYEPRVADVHFCTVTDSPGTLLACIREATAKNKASGKLIKDIAIGGRNASGEMPIQVYSEKPGKP